MFPSVSGREQSVRGKVREKGWDERLTSKGGIPQYSTLKDKHTQSYRKILMNSSRLQNNQSSPGKKLPPKTYFEKRVELADKLKSVHPVYLANLEEFEDFLTQSKLPNFYIYYSVLPLMNQIDVNGFITKAKKQIKENNSGYHRITTAIKARQQSLANLRRMVSGVKDEGELRSAKKRLIEVIGHYRILTANVIDEIRRWREGLHLHDQRAVFYYEQDENYLIRMLNDNSFVFHSELATFINFGEKNDPFFIVPLKKADGKEASEFLEILETQKNLVYYQKFMEYLATEKAHELAASTQASPVKKGSRHPQIQKVYKSKSVIPKADQASSLKKLAPSEIQQSEYENMERAKVREERLKKNQERINAIKSVYETYHNKVNLKEAKKKERKEKKAETDVEENKGSEHLRSRRSLISDNEFESMVKLKYEREKDKKMLFEHNRPRETQSVRKLPKNEDSIVENLRDIQSSLKSKLANIKDDTRKEEGSLGKMRASAEGFKRKSNDNLIKELKKEIILNLEKESKEREAQRAKRREEEEKAIEEIKAKMKREMEEKLEAKKRQKILEREELEKKLKEEEDRLGKQREIQLQLQLKLAKEKQLRELERLKREGLEKEKKYKEELQKEQQARRQREEAIEAQRREKERALEELKKRELKEQVELEIRQQMNSKYGENPRLHDESELNLLKSQKQQELAKEIELLKIKENSEIEQIRKENELRERMLKLKRDEEELKRKEVEQLMKTVIQEEKEELHREAVKKRVELEEEIKLNAKQKLLEEYKAEKEQVIEENRAARERDLEEGVYRQKVKEKIEKEMRIEAIQRTKKEMDDREARRYEMSAKLDLVKSGFNSKIEKDIDRDQIETEVKKDLIEKVIFDKQAEKESAKNNLRSQFERELMASSIPEIYRSNEADPILRKNIENYKNDDYLTGKLSSLQDQKPTNEKATANNFLEQSQPHPFQRIEDSGFAQSPAKKQPLSRNMSKVSNEELYIYSKKKNKVSEMREEPSYKLPKKLPSEEDEGYELVKVDKKGDDMERNFDVKIMRKEVKASKENSDQERYRKKKKPKQESSIDSEDSQSHKRASKKKMKKSSYKKPKRYEQDQDSQDYPKHSKKVKAKKKRESDEARSSSEDQKYRRKGKKEPRRSEISRGESVRKSESRSKVIVENEANQNIRVTESRPYDLGHSDVRVHFDAEKPSRIVNSFPDESKVQIRQVKHSVESKYEIKLEAIAEEELDEYLAGHFEQMPQIQRDIQVHDREALYRKLINELTFCMLLGYEGSVLVGLALAYHDRSKTDSRKFSIVHASTYQNENLKDFLLSCVNYIFKKDPADEIELLYRFDEGVQEQLGFSTDFNRWFDKYGNVYQKKVSDGVYERKYVVRRQFHQKCEVVLGGVNKNSFRNLFSVYLGVVMSEVDLVQVKEELRDVLVPENELCYAVPVAELFRHYLTLDESDVLKTKVKEFAKLKELLVLIVMLQKKKVKIEELRLSEFKNVVELNMKLMSQGRDVVRHCKDVGAGMNRVFYAELSQAFNLPFNFQTTSLPIESESDGCVRQVSYFRLSPLPPHKLHIMRSSLYNAELHILPTEDSRYKLLLFNAQEYNEIKEANHLDIFMYLRLFLKNVKSHTTASWKYVWLPEMTDKASFGVREFKSFLNKDLYCHDSINISYRQFLPNALIIEPQHRDLVITPPFVVGVMSMSLEHVTEGSPLYARMIDVPALRTIEIEDN